MASLFIAGPAFVACGHDPVAPESSGINGLVLRGPVSPGPEIEGQASEEPFQAVFHVWDARENKVARFQSDEKGRFRILLAPGTYTIVPDASAPLMNPEQQRKQVAVPRGIIIEMTLRFDTGLR